MSSRVEEKEENKTMEFISSNLVNPKHEVEGAKQRIYLTALETCMLLIHPIQKGLLFTLPRPTPDKFVTDLVTRLEESLSITLIHFYPLAGRLKTETFLDPHSCTVFVDCNKGPGAGLLHVAARDTTVSDIVSPGRVPGIVRKLFDFGDEYVNYDCHTRPILSVQVTELVDGVFIGFSMSHSVVDGTSFMHFVSMLSEVFGSSSSSSSFEISHVPVYQHVPMFKLPHLGLEEIMVLGNISPVVDRVFHFSSESLKLLKAKANEECATHNISSFQALASFVWRSITKARNLSADQETSCCFVTNARPRLDPPLSADVFGNFLTQVKVVSKVDELLNHELGWGAMRLNDGIKAQNSESIRGDSKWLADVISTVGFRGPKHDIHGPNSVVIGGSAWFDMYGPEFGLGKAVASRMGFGNKNDGKVTVNMGRDGPGSADLEISLIPDNMAALEADHCFMEFVTL